MNPKMTGYVDFSVLYPFLKIKLISSSEEEIEIPAIIDTGYDGELILHERRILEMGFRYFGTSQGELADGQVGQLKLYRGKLRWFDTTQDIIIGSTRSEKSFVGTSLLAYCDLRVNFKSGDVTIEKLL